MERVLLIVIIIIFTSGCSKALSVRTTDTATVDINRSNLPIKAHPHNNQPIFMFNNPNDYVDVDLYANFEIINDQSLPKDQAKSSGKLEYKDPKTGNIVAIDNIMVHARGKSRYKLCNFRPLKIDFGSKQYGNIFQNASKKIKLVTHCECNSRWEEEFEFPPGNDHEQEQRLFMEYYMYKVQETLGTTSLLTRLARITYHNTAENPSWSTQTKWAFFREREKVAAKRVKMREMEENEYPTDTQMFFPANLTSYFQGCLLDQFMYQADGSLLYIENTNGELMYFDHNTVALVNEQNNNAYFICYDWDLTGVIAPGYYKHNDPWGRPVATLKENADLMIKVILGHDDQALAKAQAHALVVHKEKMNEIVRNAAHLDTSNRSRMEKWLEENFTALEKYLSKSP